MCETSPSAAVDVNLKLTMMIAEIANRVNARIIFASSEWVYPDSEVETQLNEDFKLVITAQTNVYAMSKIVGEWAVKKYCRDFQILRFGIVYGERSVPQSAIEKVVFDSINFHRVEVGNVRTARRFIHVQDLCSGIIKSIEDSSGSNILNLTGKRLLSLRDIIKEVEEIIHRRIEIVELSQIPSIRGPSPESFVSRYNWKQQIESSTGIRALVEFYTRQRVGDGNA
jgi:nucleoside-diphosphate-sugar epimerase